MPKLSINLSPAFAALGPQREPQLCYALAHLRGESLGDHAVEWALVADASRSMRIPIVDDAQFRALIREGGAQETMVDGVAVWQLNAPIPPELRAAARSPLDHVAHALHSLLERLGDADRFALVACAEEALLLLGSTPGDSRAELARGIERLRTLNLGDETDLAQGIELALEHGSRGRVLLLTDGFTRRPERCLELAAYAAQRGMAISTIGLGSDFQEGLLTAIADQSGGQAHFAHKASDIHPAIASELRAARAAAGGLSAAIAPASGATLRRVTRIRPALSVLHDAPTQQPASIRPGDALGEGIALLIELLVPAEIESRAPLATITLQAPGSAPASAQLTVRRYAQPQALPADVRDAAARANIARLQRRAADAVAAGRPHDAARMLATAADQLSALGAEQLAQASREQAAALVTIGQTDTLRLKEITYATRRLA